MASVTYEELKAEVGRKLGIVAEAQALTADQGDRVAFAIDSVQAQLAQVGIGLSPRYGMDFAYVDAFADAAAAELVDFYQVPEPRRSRLLANLIAMPGRGLAERRLREMFKADKLQTVVDFTPP